MAIDSRFDSLICLGSGQLTYDCAVVAKELGQKVIVIEYKVTESTVLEKKCTSGEIPYLCLGKEELRQYLGGITDKVLIVSAANTYLVPSDIIGKSNVSIINWHNALLPAHKGRNAESWCIFDGDKETGITWHMLTASVDGGDILVQEKLPLSDEDTALMLYKKQCDLGRITFEKLLPQILNGDVDLVQQSATQHEQMHYSKDKPAQGVFRLEWSFEEMSRFLRAYDYGVLMLLGPMEVEIQGTKYTFSKYKIRECTDSDAEGFDGNKYVIIRENKVIELRKMVVKNER